MLFGYSFVFSASLFIPMSGDSVQHEHMSIYKKHSSLFFSPCKTPHLEAHQMLSSGLILLAARQGHRT